MRSWHDQCSTRTVVGEMKIYAQSWLRNDRLAVRLESAAAAEPAGRGAAHRRSGRVCARRHHLRGGTADAADRAGEAGLGATRSTDTTARGPAHSRTPAARHRHTRHTLVLRGRTLNRHRY